MSQHSIEGSKTASERIKTHDPRRVLLHPALFAPHANLHNLPDLPHVLERASRGIRSHEADAALGTEGLSADESHRALDRLDRLDMLPAASRKLGHNQGGRTLDFSLDGMVCVKRSGVELDETDERMRLGGRGKVDKGA